MQLEDPIPSTDFPEMHCFGIVASISSIILFHIRMDHIHLTLSIMTYHECSVMQLEDPIPTDFPEMHCFGIVASMSSIVSCHIRMNRIHLTLSNFIKLNDHECLVM